MKDQIGQLSSSLCRVGGTESAFLYRGYRILIAPSFRLPNISKLAFNPLFLIERAAITSERLSLVCLCFHIRIHREYHG